MTTYELSADDLQVIRRGQKAVGRIDTLAGKTFEVWVEAGYGAQRRQLVAERQANTNRPFGTAYRQAFTEIAKRFPFGDLDKNPTERSAAVRMVQNLPAITAWRNGLSDSERRQINHPIAILRRWEADQRAAHEVGNDAKKPSTREQLKAAQHAIAQMRRSGVETIFAMTDSPADKANSLVEFLSRDLTLGEMAQVLQFASAKATDLLVSDKDGDE